MKGYVNDFYRQFEELSLKLDSILEENKLLKKEHKKELQKVKKDLLKEFKIEKDELKDTIVNLTKQLEESNKMNEKLQNEIDRLKNQNNKNSSNSSKPSSTNIVTPKSKTGANLYNYRKKSNRKVGGQKGHQGHNLGKTQIEKLIQERKIEVKEIYHKIKGNSKKEALVKYKVGIETQAYVEKHIFEYDENSVNKLPEEYYTDVTYDESIKSLSIELGTYNVISYDRLSDFFNVITDGVIKISNGTLVNFLREFSYKSQSSINNLVDNILNEENTNTDETSSKYNGKLMYFRNYSNKNSVVYKAHEKKGHEPIKDDNILTRFLGGIMGDHDTTLYSYGTKNYECNIHIGRYLEELIQNISNITWAKKMKELLFEIKENRENYLSVGKEKFEDSLIKEYEKRYDELLEIALKENQNIKSSFYRDKANQLYRRLKKYKENHLYFMKNFKVDFDNNLSERDLRLIKTKTKVSGGFRNISVAACYADALSIIKTSIKRGINPFKSIKDIFQNKVLFSN